MRNIIFAIVAALIIAGGGWYYTHMKPTFTLEIDSRDTITSWDFQGSHKDGGEFEARVTKEMEKLQAALEGDATEPTDYSIYVSMAGQHTLLGDGKNTLKYLEKALAIDSVKTGLAWHNVGVLMERLGAVHTARTAYARAVEAQSQIDACHIARFSFLIKHFSEDKEAVGAALNEAAVEFGEDDLFVMNARAEWFEMQEEWQEAIGAWEKILAGAPEEIKAGIREKIRKLRDGIQKSKDDEAAHEGQ